MNPLLILMIALPLLVILAAAAWRVHKDKHWPNG